MAGGTGVLGYLKYIYESTFKAGGTATRAFGAAQKLDSSSKKNNLTPIWGLGSADASIIADGKVEGSLSISFMVTNLWWLPAIMGGSFGTPSGSGPYTWTPALANTLPSMVIENGLELGASDYVTVFKGVVAKTLTLSIELGNNPITAKLECLYADETASTTSTYATAATDTETAIFNFAMSKLEIPTGTVIGEVDHADLTIERNTELVYGLGDRRATTHTEGKREFSVDVSSLLENTTLLEKFYANTGSATGPASSSITEISSITIGFSNDGWSTAVATSRRFTIVLTGCKLENFSPPMDVESGVMQSFTILARTCTVTVINNTASGSKPTDVP